VPAPSILNYDRDGQWTRCHKHRVAQAKKEKRVREREKKSTRHNLVGKIYLDCDGTAASSSTGTKRNRPADEGYLGGKDEERGKMTKSLLCLRHRGNTEGAHAFVEETHSWKKKKSQSKKSKAEKSERQG